MTWTCKPFHELTIQELYAILQLRAEVFIVEQNCVFQDMDNKDPHCYHLMAWDGALLAAYSRLVPAGVAFTEPSIGRVVNSPLKRGTGIGKELMLRSIETVYTLWGKEPIKIGAQFYLKKFYSSLGFRSTSDIYLEDNIEHIEMILHTPR